MGDEEFIIHRALCTEQHGMYLDGYDLWCWHSPKKPRFKALFNRQANPGKALNGVRPAVVGYLERIEVESEDHILHELESGRLPHTGAAFVF